MQGQKEPGGHLGLVDQLDRRSVFTEVSGEIVFTVVYKQTNHCVKRYYVILFCAYRGMLGKLVLMEKWCVSHTLSKSLNMTTFFQVVVLKSSIQSS